MRTLVIALCILFLAPTLAQASIDDSCTTNVEDHELVAAHSTQRSTHCFVLFGTPQQGTFVWYNVTATSITDAADAPLIIYETQFISRSVSDTSTHEARAHAWSVLVPVGPRGTNLTASSEEDSAQSDVASYCIHTLGWGAQTPFTTGGGSVGLAPCIGDSAQDDLP